jgi:ABC-type nitrate/sulfonate/bicarbonate transport system substrate-binding protein
MEPQVSQILADKVAEVIVSGFFAELMPDVPLSGSWFASDFAESNPKAAQAFAKVYDQAVELIAANPEQSKKAYLKYSPIRPDVLARVQLNKWIRACLQCSAEQNHLKIRLLTLGVGLFL